MISSMFISEFADSKNASANRMLHYQSVTWAIFKFAKEYTSAPKKKKLKLAML